MTDESGEDVLMRLPPALRARVVRYVTAETARHKTTIDNLAAQNKRLIANKDRQEERIGNLLAQMQDRDEQIETLCAYMDLMDSPKWDEIEYSDYKDKRGKYVSLRQSRDAKFAPPKLLYPRAVS